LGYTVAAYVLLRRVVSVGGVGGWPILDNLGVTVAAYVLLRRVVSVGGVGGWPILDDLGDTVAAYVLLRRVDSVGLGYLGDFYRQMGAPRHANLETAVTSTAAAASATSAHSYWDLERRQASTGKMGTQRSLFACTVFRPSILVPVPRSSESAWGCSAEAENRDCSASRFL
jgi:hypothetical protein